MYKPWNIIFQGLLILPIGEHMIACPKCHAVITRLATGYTFSYTGTICRQNAIQFEFHGKHDSIYPEFCSICKDEIYGVSYPFDISLSSTALGELSLIERGGEGLPKLYQGFAQD